MDSVSTKSYLGDETTESGPELRSMPIIQRHSPLSRRDFSGPKDPSSSFPSFVDSASDISDDDSRYGYFVGDKDDDAESAADDPQAAVSEDLSEDSIPEAPIYVLPSANCIALPHSPHTVLERITNFLRAKSIVNSFHSSKEEVRMDCCTDNLLCFAIFLWRNHRHELVVQNCIISPSAPPQFIISTSESSAIAGNSTDSAVKSEVLVELQRRRGCSILMSCVKRALFLSIRSGVTPNDEPLRPRGCGKIPRRIHKRYAMDSSCKVKAAEKKAVETKEVFSQSCNLLKSGYKDQNRLGLENLISLTNPYSPVDFPRGKLARALVFNEGNVAPYIRQALLTYMGSSSSSFDDPRYSYYVMRMNSVDEEFSQVNAMDILALRFVVNALDLVKNSKPKDTSERSEQICSGFWSELLQSFHEHLREASFRPQEAALSAKCLYLLANIFSDCQSTIFGSAERNVWKNVVRAQEFGKLHHCSLEQESRNLVATLRNLGYS